MTPLVAVAWAVWIADAVALASIAAMAIFGFYHGLFQATVAALVVFTAMVSGVALAPGVAVWLESLDCPASGAMPLAFFGLLASILAVARVAIGYFVREDDVRFSDAVDKILGALMGCVAGILLGSAMLVGWSMCELPHGFRLNAPGMKIDLGVRALWVFVRCTISDSEERERLFHGDVFREEGDPRAKQGVRLRASEPFADIDGDWMHDDAEPILDYNRDGIFTKDQVVIDRQGGKPGTRDIGLVDCYWLSAWRTIRVIHAPAIKSPAVIACDGVPKDGALLCKLEAMDPDEGDVLRFTLKKHMDDDEPLVVADADGSVRLREGAAVSGGQKISFTAIVTDRSGLVDEKRITVAIGGKGE